MINHILVGTAQVITGIEDGAARVNGSVERAEQAGHGMLGISQMENDARKLQSLAEQLKSKVSSFTLH